MKTFPVVLLSALVCFFSCTQPAKKPQIKDTVAQAGISTNDSTGKSPGDKNALKPLWGYRFIITGDFDGDGKKEKLTEHFFSGIDNKETNKFLENAEYDTLVTITEAKKPYSFMSCDNPAIKNLTITRRPRMFGALWIKNEGDLDGDGADEISYVVDWGDYSNLNDCMIMSYKNGAWKQIYTFPVWEWQLPDLPETYNQRGPFGLENKIAFKDDTANQKVLAEFNAFKGLIKKVGDGKVRITFRNSDEGKEDSKIVRLGKGAGK